MLDEDEYNSARASTLNAHYTSPVVIKAIYTCLENMGFQTGNILDPACGSGNFFGLAPESKKDSKLYGVERDGVTGRIAKQLYQNASIAVQGFEETNLPAALNVVPQGLPANNRNCIASGQRYSRAAGGGDYQDPPFLNIHHF